MQPAANQAVFDYRTFQDLIDRFAAELPAVLSRHWTIADLAPRVERLLTVAESPFTIAVVGQMRAGKSSLLNALVRADLAVTGVNETTATVNWFKHGSKEQSQRFRVVWKDRPAEEFPLAEIKNWIGDSEKARMTRCIEFFADNAFLRQANIVDTPGTRSVIEDHSTALKEFLTAQRDSAVQESNTRREGEAADAIVYVLMPVARQSDKDLLADFEQTTRMPGASPYNSMAVIHKWETLEKDDAYADAESKCERLAATLDGLVSLVLPVSAPLAMACEWFTDDFWIRMLNLTANSASDVLDDLLLTEQEFVNWEDVRCALPAIERQRLRQEFKLPWPSFQQIVKLARRQHPATIEDLRNAVSLVSGIGRLRETLQEHFLARSRMIKAFSVLSKAWEPCQIAAGRLRNHKNRFSRLLEEALGAGQTLEAAIADGAGQLEPVQRYVSETQRTVEDDLRQVGDVLRRLGEVELMIKDAYDDMEADRRMLDSVEQRRKELGSEWFNLLRSLFGYGGPTILDRVAPLQRGADTSLGTNDLEAAIGRARTIRTRCQGDVRRIFEHAILRLEQIADCWDEEAMQCQTHDTLGE